jgi:hypothetical protein
MLLGISGSRWIGLFSPASGLFEGFLSVWQHLVGIWLNCLIAKLLASDPQQQRLGSLWEVSRRWFQRFSTLRPWEQRYCKQA